MAFENVPPRFFNWPCAMLLSRCCSKSQGWKFGTPRVRAALSVLIAAPPRPSFRRHTLFFVLIFIFIFLCLSPFPFPCALSNSDLGFHGVFSLLTIYD